LFCGVDFVVVVFIVTILLLNKGVL